MNAFKSIYIIILIIKVSYIIISLIIDSNLIYTLFKIIKAFINTFKKDKLKFSINLLKSL